jgi:hypothetical protein
MSPGDRSFYGGEPLIGGAGGEISTGKYRGSEAESSESAGWKCPACMAENVTPLKFGCAHCGSGKPGMYVGQPQAVVEEPDPEYAVEPMHRSPPREVLEVDPLTGEIPSAVVAFSTWLQRQENPHFHVTENEGILRAAFLGGWLAAMGQTMIAPPVTVDTPELRPEGKRYRTIIAALEIFKDQILSQSPDEIETGEWCSMVEVDALIAELKAGA